MKSVSWKQEMTRYVRFLWRIKACLHFIRCCTVQLGKDLMKTEADLQSVRHAKAQSDAEYTANITSQTTGQHFIIFVLYPPTL